MKHFHWTLHNSYLQKPITRLTLPHLRLRYSDQNIQRSMHTTRNFSTTVYPAPFCFTISICLKCLMLISTNWINEIGGHKVCAFLTSNACRYSWGMNNQTNMQNQQLQSGGTSEGFSGNNQLIRFYSTNHHIRNSLDGGQLTSQAICTLYETSARNNSPLGTRQWTRKAIKMLKLAIQAIVKAEADIENRCTSSCVNLQISADTTHSCVNSTRRCVYVGLSVGCYPELALTTAVPRGKRAFL